MFLAFVCGFLVAMIEMLIINILILARKAIKDDINDMEAMCRY